MLTIDQIVTRLKDRKLKEVAKQSGVSYLTVWKIATGRAGNVSYETVVKLSEYLERAI